MSSDLPEPRHRIVAVGLLTEQELRLLGPNFFRSEPVNETPCFGGLLQAIDEADREAWRERDSSDSDKAEGPRSKTPKVKKRVSIDA